MFFNSLIGFMAYQDGTVPAVTGLIESVQQVAITLTTGVDATKTATISSVDTARSIVVPGWYTATNSSNARDEHCRVELTDATTVTVKRTGTSGTIIYYATVVQFATGVVTAIRQGTITIGVSSTQQTATITSTDKTKSLLLYLGTNATAGGSATMKYYFCDVEFTNNTTITANAGDSLSSTTREVGYVAVEFDPSVVQSVQHLVISSTGTSLDTAISAVTMANTWLTWCGCYGNLADEGILQATAKLTSTTNVRTQKQTTGTVNVSAVAIEFVASKISVQHGIEATHNQNDATVNTTISAVDLAKSFVSYGGHRSLGDEPDETLLGGELTSTTNLRTHRAGASASAGTDVGIYTSCIVSGV